jgi:hypothetical protein
MVLVLRYDALRRELGWRAMSMPMDHGATSGTLAAARALAEAIFSTESGPPPSARLDWLVVELDDFMGRAGARTRLVLGLSIFAISWLAPLLSLRFRTIRRLSLPARIQALERLERSHAALPLLATKAILSVLYYEHPDAAREIGFDGHCLRDGAS